MKNNIGKTIYKWAQDLFPLNRSLSGEGVRETLAYINNLLPDLKIKHFNSGQKAFDWTIPPEWEVKKAFIKNSKGDTIIDFKNLNLHLVGYSIAVNQKMKYEELIKHLYYIKNMPDAVPYKTSYYEKNWGFCLSYNDFKKLDKNEIYEVVIDSKLFSGKLNYGELIIEGSSKKEVLFSTYICHPSMANNEISGPVVLTAVAKYIKSINNFYTYRILFIPETIGSIAYLSEKERYKYLKKNVIAGFQVTCVGDEKNCSYIETRNGDTYSDRIIQFYLKQKNILHKRYSFLERGSDERQWCSPGIDLPVASLINTKYGKYKEYHTSLDDLNFISPKGLEFSYNNLKNCIEILETNKTYKSKFLCEPQLSKRNLYVGLNNNFSREKSKLITNILAYSDGINSTLDISEILEEDFFLVNELSKILLKNELIIECQ
jgi:aminopeptidase-like protein